MIIDENTLFEKLNGAKNVLLVEPDHRKKYPPLALAKIKTYLTSKGISSKFSNTVLPEKFDLICITTLFTYYSETVFSIIRNKGFFNADTPVIVGGVFATLMPEQFEKFGNVFVFKGYSKILDSQAPDKSMMIPRNNKWDGFSWVFTSRGCPNRCAYCAVWRIEQDRWYNKNWLNHLHSDTKNVVIMDNNISSMDPKRLTGIVDILLERKIKVMLEGVDCKFVTKEIAKILGRVKYVRHGLRTAFDRLEEDGTFQSAIKLLKKEGVNKESFMAYVLYNFVDKPHDANYRMEQCLALGIRAYPQCFRPLNTLHKRTDFVGKHWTLRLTKAFRTFWIMKSIRHGYVGISFDQYIKSKEAKDRWRLTESDINMWETNSENK